MSQSHNNRPQTEIIDPLAVFGPPPLVEGESEADFQSLLAQFLRDLRPADIVEQMHVHDVAHLTWELLRLRRLRLCYLRDKANEQLSEKLSENLRSDDAADRLMGRWLDNDPSANKRVAAILDRSMVSMDSLFAYALLGDIEAFERLERLIASTEARRNATLREIDRRRSELGTRTRRFTEQMDEAEFASLAKNGDAA